MLRWMRWFFVKLTCQCITTEWSEDDRGDLRCTVCGGRVIAEDREQL